MIYNSQTHCITIFCDVVCVAPFNCRPKPKICHLKPVTCRPAQVSSRHRPVTNCRPEPPCVVTDIPKREAGPLKQNDWGPSSKLRGPGFGGILNSFQHHCQAFASHDRAQRPSKPVFLKLITILTVFGISQQIVSALIVLPFFQGQAGSLNI